MYVVTFYSFKGGVGRTLALANVGLQLARTGRRILLVDFDIEAPGMHTFNVLKPREEYRGLVDYVGEFLTTDAAPDVRDYVYEALGAGREDGRLWVMPAGSSDVTYAEKLNAISWEALYEDRNGFIMMEDMKAQWQKAYEPDYVLIDSRTGHTDTGGICTRQMPDAVVILFFPNEQNLSGLRPVVSCIRDEDKKTAKATQLHFVMSNVPDLDDEDEILANLEKRFQDELGYDSLSATIHRYDSLLLLQQSLFIVERPKSRLAREYKQLAHAITAENVQDVKAVVQTLTRRKRPLRAKKAIEQSEKRIDQIMEYHPQNGELLYLLAMELKGLGRSKKAEMLLARSIECGYRSPEALLRRADALQKDGDSSDALDCVWEAFGCEEVEVEFLSLGVDILRRIEPEHLLKIANLPAFKTLGAGKCNWISQELNWCRQGLQASVDLLSRFYGDNRLSVNSVRVKLPLMLSLIGLGKFADAIKLISDVRPKPEDLEIDTCFNYAMAEWGLEGIPPKDMFGHVVDLAPKRERLSGANYSQCLAIALWAVQKPREALEAVDRAISAISRMPGSDLSCWRYLTVTSEVFREDCEAIKRLIQGEDIKPLCFEQSDFPASQQNC
jgi:MinD-like ATPase involved in chromosome partitioning or flagellar assembly